jgi:hypothetical protein
MSEKEVLPVKKIIENLWAGENPLIDPLVPTVIEAWNRVVPGSLRPVTCLEGMREGILHILVSNPVAGQQLQLLKDSLRDEINEILGKVVVKGFRIKSGSFPAMRFAVSSGPGPHTPRDSGKS